MNKVSVLIANCLQADPRHTISAINWANDNGFKILAIIAEIIPSKTVGAGGQPSIVQINRVYAETTLDNFEKITGGPYTLDSAVKIQMIMAKDQGDLQKVR